MLFNSIEFPIFLLLTLALFWSLRGAGLRVQNSLLVVASYVFYGWWDWRFLSLIVISSAVDYAVGRSLGASTGGRTRRLLLLVSLIANLGLLGFFKYCNFFVASFADMLARLGLEANLPTLRIILPVGISFYTFQTLSYTIDIYRRRMEPTRDVVAFFAFVCFFPQLVAGPIERARNLLPQFLSRRELDPDRATDGLRQILWGLAKKVVVADNLGPFVDQAFALPVAASGLQTALGVLLFAFQIYCDFSGYSDIAIGTARLFGFDLMRNFAFPYFSRDIAEFWRRWHISLSTWFRDFLYIPLGGSRCPRWRTVGNVLITFTVSGLWHGANWTFVVWGLLNGLYFVPLLLAQTHKQHVGTVARGQLLPSPGDGCRMLATFALVVISWVFFRADSIGHALHYLTAMVTSSWHTWPPGATLRLVLVAALVIVEWLQRDRQHGLEIDDLPRPLRWLIYCIVLDLVLLLGNFGEVEFIYFQF
jgi:D-alanyl-lipoteichoic acid acyltransferase DltB (MBOAT superfamily)